jgi:2,3,4,5-tetrahydropyridine-2,6-dicarboxylate N-succinyltransferase
VTTDALETIIAAAAQGARPLEDQDVTRAVESVLADLDAGRLRVAEKIDGVWRTHAWIKQAILLYFRLRRMETIEVGPFEFRDKIPLKKDLERQGVRVVRA